MTSVEAIALEAFYPYNYQGREMIAVRSPFAMAATAEDIVGRLVRIDGRRYRVIAVERQISGPIAFGEPIGIEVAPVLP